VRCSELVDDPSAWVALARNKNKHAQAPRRIRRPLCVAATQRTISPTAPLPLPPLILPLHCLTWMPLQYCNIAALQHCSSAWLEQAAMQSPSALAAKARLHRLPQSPQTRCPASPVDGIIARPIAMYIKQTSRLFCPFPATACHRPATSFMLRDVSPA